MCGMKWIVLAVGFFALSLPALGQAGGFIITGNDYLARCRSDKTVDDLINNTYCSAYINGLRDGTDLLKPANGCSVFSIPTAVQNVQVYRIVDKYIVDHPTQTHLPIAALFLMAMRDSFPCPSPSAPSRK